MDKSWNRTLAPRPAHHRRTFDPFPDPRPTDKTKVESLVSVQDQLSKLSKKVPKFWFTSLSRCPTLQQYFDPADGDALAHLTDIKIVHSKTDVRDFVVEFVRPASLSLSRDFFPAQG